MADGYLLDGDSIERLREDHRLLEQMVTPALRRRLITRPSGGSAGPRPYIITQTDGETPAGMLAIYGPSTPTAVTAKRAANATDITETDADVDIVPSITGGVTFTGCLCWAGKAGSTLHMVAAEAGTIFDATAAEEILPDASGEVDLEYIDHFGDSRTATVTAENDLIGLTVSNGAAIVVEFLWGSQRFRISELECP